MCGAVGSLICRSGYDALGFVSVRLSDTISSNHRKTVLVVAQGYRNQSEFIRTNRKSIG